MALFDYLNSILYKSKKIESETVDSDPEFVPFMIQRWCSMHSPEIATVVNMTGNRYWSVMDNKGMWFDFYNTIIPRTSFKRSNYIKKKKDEKTVKNSENIQKVAECLEISVREINEYVENFNLDIPNDKKTG